jgi:hypothetical protein
MRVPHRVVTVLAVGAALLSGLTISSASATSASLGGITGGDAVTSSVWLSSRPTCAFLILYE